MGRTRTHRIVGILALALVAAVLSSACGSSSASTTSLVHVGAKQDGRTVHSAVGDRVEVVLNNTYWKIGGSSDPSVLVAVGAPKTIPSMNCVPGGGCGTVTQVFRVVGAGTATLSASRTSCGEALRCTGGAGSYRVTIVAS